MYAKVVFRNAKRSVKDYLIYIIELSQLGYFLRG